MSAVPEVTHFAKGRMLIRYKFLSKTMYIVHNVYRNVTMFTEDVGVVNKHFDGACVCACHTTKHAHIVPEQGLTETSGLQKDAGTGGRRQLLTE